MNFIENLKEVLNDERSITENGAVGYKTTGTKLLDLNYQVSSLRNQSEKEIEDKFALAFYENKLLTIKWLFYASDVRQGLGERKLFRTCMKYLGENHPDVAKAVIGLIPEYSRWDNMFCLLDTDLKDTVIKVIKDQLSKDISDMNAGNTISLLAKWLPSKNASSKETKRLAGIIHKELGMTERNYRQLLSQLRKYLNVVEVSMSSKEWSSIDYSTVPSRANLIYNGAFLRNDEDRRREYLDSLQKGETKINSSVLFPHDIVHKYMGSYRVKDMDITLEELWKALPDYVQGDGNTICVADGSGSMNTTVGNTKVTALSVANALAIYFAERSSGQFKNKYITFSENPRLVDFSNVSLLKEKIEIALRHSEVANTNIEAVFDLILQTAIYKNMKQEDLPSNILILSDMEFDTATVTHRGYSRYIKPDKTLFSIFSDRYAEQGYKLPRLVFWNICSRTNTIPVKENELGVALVSGFSPNVVKMVLSNSTDPFECMLEQINSERYNVVHEAIIGLV